MGDEPVENDPRDGEAARREDSTVSEDATLRRPALDPAIPRDARDLLRARGDLLAPAGPDSRRRLLPADGERREATVSNAVAGLTTALFVAVVGATPWAVGVLVFQQPVAWQSAAGRYGLLLAELIIAVTAIAFGTRVARFGEPRVEDEAVSVARTYRGRYLTEADLDADARVLLRRAQDAVHAINAAEIVRADLLDEPATSALLDEQEWQIALAVREQARLRSAAFPPGRAETRLARGRAARRPATGRASGRAEHRRPGRGARALRGRGPRGRRRLPRLAPARGHRRAHRPAPRPARPHRRRPARHRRTRRPHRARPRPPPVLHRNPGLR